MLQILGINHIGLAPKDPIKARWFFTQVLGLPALGDELVREQQTLTIMIGSSAVAQPATTPQSASRLEILVPELDAHDSNKKLGPIAAFLDKRGSGIHHLALTVQDVTAALVHLKAMGVRLIDETPRHGAHHTRIAFVHPESTGGLLVELVEPAAAP